MSHVTHPSFASLRRGVLGVLVGAGLGGAFAAAPRVALAADQRSDRAEKVQKAAKPPARRARPVASKASTSKAAGSTASGSAASGTGTPRPGTAEQAAGAPSGGAATRPLTLASSVDKVVESCVDHHTNAQELRMSGKLLESRAEMRGCAAEACPALLQRDCVGWLDQIDTQIPSITFRASVDGQSRTDGQVSIDGVARPELTSGKALELDPGKHRLRVVLAGVAPYEEELISTEGERYRMVEVELSSPEHGAPRVDTHRPVPLTSYVLGGVAIGAAISGGIWGASSLSLREELRDTCAPTCSERRVSELRRRALITDLSWTVSAASLIGATTFFLLRPELPVEVDVSWLPGGGMGHVRFDAF